MVICNTFFREHQAGSLWRIEAQVTSAADKQRNWNVRKIVVKIAPNEVRTVMAADYSVCVRSTPRRLSRVDSGPYSLAGVTNSDQSREPAKLRHARYRAA